jgi:ribosomal protein L16 Arg81 hydroxylase
MPRRLLGGLTPSVFLRRHWQKRPLFVRGAFPAGEPMVGLAELLSLAARGDVESRIVERVGRRRETRHGPFATPRAKARDWTILVSGVNLESGAELGAAFLDWLNERGLPDARYRDPQLSPSPSPGRIPAGMLQFAERVLRRIRWSRRDVETFLGEYLTLPKPHVVFRPEKATRGLSASLVRLDAKTQLLYAGGRFFINGERIDGGSRALKLLADRRWVHGRELARGPLARLISAWQRAGYVHFEAP